MDVSLTFPVLRVMMGDLDAAVRRYPDEVLRDGVKAVVQLAKLPGYTLTVDGQGITPDPDPNRFALVCYHTAKMFVDPGV